MERLKKIGTVKAFSSKEIKHSRIGIGFEKLDRGLFNPDPAYDILAETGAKWVRLQSGWARTEKVRGVYDFAWLDHVVDNLIGRGMQPWMCLCYGNGLYSEMAASVFGAVGCPPRSDEEKAAWSRYIAELAEHYRGKIQWYEVWNEPDGEWCWKHGVNGTEYGELIKLTASAVKSADPDAKIIGGSQCCGSLDWLSEVLDTGAGDVMDGYTYHNYCSAEDHLPQMVRGLKALVHWYNPDIKIIQGETGTQSQRGGAGALRTGAWTPLRQAKYIVRHTITDFISDVMFSSYFSCMDMAEALNGTTGDLNSVKDYGYFGILSADFDENGIACRNFKKKLAYRTIQVLASVFREDFSLAPLPLTLKNYNSPLRFGPEDRTSAFMTAGFSRPNGSRAFAYWKPVDLMTETYDGTISIDAALPCTPRLIDLLDGTVYEIPENMIVRGKKTCFIHLENFPVKDYPMLLTFGNFAEIALN